MTTDLERFAKIASALADKNSSKVDTLFGTLKGKAEVTVNDLKQALVSEKILDEATTDKAVKWVADLKDAPDLENYFLVRKLGQGGMGAVYEARHRISRKRTAIKVLTPNLASDKGFIDRFMREAQNCAAVEHPNIVGFIDAGTSAGVPYFAMEFVDGRSVQAWIDRFEKQPLKGCPKGAMPIGDALFITIEVAKALIKAEELGLVHRDIKPDNIMITSTGQVKLADLGLAKMTDDNNSMTQTGAGFGTPYYMPLEQAVDAKHVDTRSDIYALGATLYRLVTGQVPFDGETAYDVIMKKKEGKYPPIKVFAPDAPSKLDLIIAKMMEKKAESRYQTASELFEALDAFGMHHSKLSFVSNAMESTSAANVERIAPTNVNTGMGASSKAKTSAAAMDQTMPGKKGSTNAGASSASNTQKQKPAGASEPDLWFLRYKDVKGKQVKTKANTARVRTLIQSNQLDETVEAARSPEGPFRRLQAYNEFEPLLRQRMQARKVDQKTVASQSKMQDIVANYDRDTKRLKMKRKLSDMGTLVWSLILTGVVLGGGGYAVWNYVLKPEVDKNIQNSKKLQEEIDKTAKSMGRPGP